MSSAVPPRHHRKSPTSVWSLSRAIVIALGLILTQGPPALAQTLPNARVIEWDGPLMGQDVEPGVADPSPGALAVDNGRVWYVTRLGVQRLVRFTPGSRIDTDPATFNWWELSPATATTGGLRLRPAGNTAYIRTVTDLQRIDTVTNQLTRWVDGLISMSDVAIRQNGSTAVFTTGAVQADVDACPFLQDLFVCPDETPFVVQRLVPGSNGAASITRWEVGGGAGSVYLSGIDVHPSSGHLVYYSEPDTNQIGELNTTTGAIRRWTLEAVSSVTPVRQPRQLDVAMGGLVWVVTGSGHIVRLNPTTNEILAAPIPPVGASDLNNPFGIDADGVVGFTTTGGPALDKVGMLFPDGLTTVILPSFDTAAVDTLPVSGLTGPTTQQTAVAPPIVKFAPAMETETTGGTFIEALIDLGMPENPDDSGAPSMQPLGIANDPSGPLGTYYSAIGGSVNRIARVSLPVSAVGAVSGGGWITTSSIDPVGGSITSTDTGTFGLVAMRKNEGDPVKGHVTFQKHGTGEKVISLELTDLTFIDGNKAMIGGACKVETSDCLTFRVDITDNGQPRETVRDLFEIARDAIGLGGAGTAVDGGPLQGGNLKVHRQQQQQQQQ